MRLSVEAWDPPFGTPAPDAPATASEAEVDPSVEVEPSRWSPLSPESGRADRVHFVDGVRRIDALVWIETDDEPQPVQGLCASYAAGVVSAADAAEVAHVRVERALVSRAAAADLVTSAGTFRRAPHEDDQTGDLSSGVQDRLRALEALLASSLAGEDGLLVVDGPLSARHETLGAVGYVKSHAVHYLPPDLHETMARLEPGQRTPLFRTTTSWSRYSSYLRLPCERRHDWSGIARLEVEGSLPLGTARTLVERAAATLPRFASTPFKDPRAPQNLFPIGGLERELRRRLGDPALVYRALRRAAASLV